MKINFQIIQDALAQLNSWEQLVKNKQISDKLFLTRQTAEGLRVTLLSTINLTSYLVDKYHCQYVLTGRLNQDALEVRLRSPIFKHFVLKNSFIINLKSN